MSIFSIIKRGRAQAKEHTVKQADKVKEEAVKLPYRHVPTHAATDALATAPASWKQDDRSKIKEQNQRRSAMASGGMGHGGLPRVGSSLSYVSYPSVYANPVVPLPKNYSYSSIPSSWRDRVATTPEASEGLDYFDQSEDNKGKGKEIATPFTVGTASPMLSSGRTSPLSSRAVPAVVSVGIGRGSENLSSSEDEKERRTQVLKTVSYNHEIKPSISRNSSSTREGLHRLHPAHSRRKLETHTHTSDRHYPPPAKSTYFSAPRPTSRRAPNMDMSIPPVPVLPGQFYATHAPSSSASSVISVGMAISTAPTSADSTPPPSTAGDIAPSEPQHFRVPTVDIAPSVTHSRRTSLSEWGRSSIDTIIPSSNEPRVRDSSQAPSTRGRRLSKSRPRQSSEAERPASVNNATKTPMGPVQFTKPSRSATENMIHELNQLEPKTPYSLISSNSAPRPEHSRRRLSKDRIENTQTDKKHRWSFFGRKNSITTA
ncbi:hypothetical protein HD806DRAFT_270405 [Xylariaceae sp. AK1471]|nr:hypothetical protein HD806DRAFT_270405 [Xylariaceae sp. AK1471]